MFGRGQAIITGIRPFVRIAGIDLDTGTVFIILTAQISTIDGGCRFLDSAYIIQAVTCAADKVGVIKFHRTAIFITGTGQHFPVIENQVGDLFFRSDLRSDLYHFNTCDAMPLITGVVAIAMAQVVKFFSTQTAECIVRATWFLLECTHGRHPENRSNHNKIRGPLVP